MFKKKTLVFYIPSPKVQDIKTQNSFHKKLYEMKFRSYMYISALKDISKYNVNSLGVAFSKQLVGYI